MTVLVVSPDPQGEQIKTLLNDASIEVVKRASVNLAIDLMRDEEVEHLIIVPDATFDPWPLTTLIRSTDNILQKIPIIIVSDESNWSYQRLMMNYFNATALLGFKELSILPGMLKSLYHTPFKPKILVVDDNPVSLEHVVRFLKPLYDVTCANGGSEALKTFASKTFDLVMVDLRMPKMNGFTLIEKLLSIDPTVMSMGLSAEMDLEAGMKLHSIGATAAFSKSKMQSAPLINAIHTLFVQQHYKRAYAIA